VSVDLDTVIQKQLQAEAGQVLDERSLLHVLDQRGVFAREQNSLHLDRLAQT
jgi:hypothetical protein